MKRLLALAILLSPATGLAEVSFDKGCDICFDNPGVGGDFVYETFEKAGAPKPSKKLADYIKNKECLIVESGDADEELFITVTYLVMCKEECGWKQAGRYDIVQDWHNEEGE